MTEHPQIEVRAGGGDLFAVPGFLLRGRLVCGIASSSTPNSHDYALLAHGCDIRLPVPLLDNHSHGGRGVGEVIFALRSQTQIAVIARLFDNESGDAAWDAVMAGEHAAFSGAASRSGTRCQGVARGVTYYDAWRLSEVSLCPTGANPDAKILGWWHARARWREMSSYREIKLQRTVLGDGSFRYAPGIPDDDQGQHGPDMSLTARAVRVVELAEALELALEARASKHSEAITKAKAAGFHVEVGGRPDDPRYNVFNGRGMVGCFDLRELQDFLATR